MSVFRLACAGCGTPAVIYGDPHPFRCRRADRSPEIDHVVTKIIGGAPPAWPGGKEGNPFVRYRSLLYSYDVARTWRVPDEEFVQLVQRLDDAVASVSGQRFQVTPFGRDDRVSRALGFSERGGVWIKDETGNVSGSHKSRHLAGIMLYLQVLELIGRARERGELAIASCGNAALAAAVVARAAGWQLKTFIPPDASASVERRLRDLGATLIVCPRQPGEQGDPCFLRFKEALSDGAFPFCCQGPENGFTIEGGETLAYEMIDTLGDDELDALVVQVGGGALASSCIQGFERAIAIGRIRRMPRIYTVQTEGAAPLARAYEHVVKRSEGMGIDEALRYAATHRAEFMWPWESEPRSVAHGILDDETYDWLALLHGMLKTGGAPVIVGDQTLGAANQQARELTGIDVDHTGSAGLAGLMALRNYQRIAPDERTAVIFSGVRRDG
jgi:threonine synthase